LSRKLVFIFGLVVTLAVLAPPARAQGHFEFGFHFGSWGLNLVKGVIDKAVSGAIKQPMLDQIKGQYPDAVENHADTSSNFDSGGSNYGFEARWYPGGTEGSFSIGLSVEKTNMRVEMKEARADISVSYTDENGKYVSAGFNGAGSGRFDIHPLSFNLSFRWDIIPRAVIHPYITFGGGISTSRALDDSTLAYSYSGQLAGSSIPAETVEGSETKTLRELRDEALADPDNDFPIPNFIPFLQLNLGLKVRLMRSVHLFVDGGVFNGFMASAGIALRI